jgi:rhodanese-related sulfurtransferase
VVVYCWSPGCNAGDKGALEFAKLGYDVKLMIGGFEYWAREGYPVEDADGVHRRPVDPLTGVPRVRTRA